MVEENHRSAGVIDAAPPRPSGQLRVVAGTQQLVGLSCELAQPLDDDRPGGHVDAKGQGLSGQYDLDEPRTKELFDGLLEGGDEPGVVRRHTMLEVAQPVTVTEHLKIICR